MKLNITFAHLHDPFFMVGVNMSEKLDVRTRSGLLMEYDTESKELLVYYKNMTTHIPSSNIRSYNEATTPAPVEVKPAGKPAETSPVASKMGLSKAQTNTPFDGVGK